MKYDNKTFMGVAELFAENSYCKRAKVGACLVKDNRIIATGYNGTLPNRDNNCEDEDNKTKEEVLHAEQNVITFCAKHGIKTDGATMYITLAPCKSCAKLIASCGIKKVVYKDKYHSDGIDLLREFGVMVLEYK